MLFEKLSSVGEFLIHGTDPYSWLLARLCAEVTDVYANNSLRDHVKHLFVETNTVGQTALDRYLRKCFLRRKTLHGLLK